MYKRLTEITFVPILKEETVMATVNASETVFELPANNPRKRASPLSVLFFRYSYNCKVYDVSILDMLGYYCQAYRYVTQSDMDTSLQYIRHSIKRLLYTIEGLHGAIIIRSIG